MANTHRFSFAGAAAWLVALAAQVSGYTNPYVAGVLFLIGTGFFFAAIWDWSRQRGWLPVSLGRKDRIPYVEIRKLANAKGWKLNDSSAGHSRALDLEDAMQEAAFYGRLRVWGRSCETSMGSNPLLPIPNGHFKHFKFHYGYLTRDDVENDSTYTWKPDICKNRNSFDLENYCDLHVSKSDIKRLLRSLPPS